MSQKSDEEKNESPTAHRLKKARQEGQVPRSRELTSFLMLLTGLIILWSGGEGMARQLSAMLSSGFHFDHSIVSDENKLFLQTKELVVLALLSLLPVMAGLVLIAVCSPMMLGGLVFSRKAIKVNFGKLNPLKGLKRMVSAQAWTELLKAILKAVLTGSVTGVYLWASWPALLRLTHEPPVAALGHAMNLTARCGLFVLTGLIPMVAYDIFLQLYRHFKQLRMSRQEVRDEFKQQEGDPHVKNRIRQQMRVAARRRMMADVPWADVIVTNPTHYSVALQYDEKKMRAPKVLAKGAGEVALRIRETGAENRIPLLEAPPLARALYRHSEIGESVPGALYAAVAEVLAWVWRLRLWKEQGGLIPKKPEDLPVPDALDFAGENRTDG